MSEGYRLEALLALRERSAVRAKEELARRLSALARARADVEQAGRDLDSRRLRREEAERRSGVSPGAAGSHQGADRHRSRLRAEEVASAAALGAAAERTERERSAVEAARAKLASAEKDRQALAEHRERWIRARDRLRQAAEEGESDERAGHAARCKARSE